MTIDSLVTPDRTDHAPGAPDLPLTEDSVRAILDIVDPALRNLWITASYADLAQRLLAVLRTDQSWCTFAIWASNAAGVSIRGEELPSILRSMADSDPDHVAAAVDAANRHSPVLSLSRCVGRLERSRLEHLVVDAVRDVARDLAHGNTLVYAELAPLFVRFVEVMESDPLADADAVLAATGLPDGADPLVHQAFRNYALAACCWDDERRAQLVLSGNIAAVLHEQQRLQPDLEHALDAALVDLGAELEASVGRWLPARVRARLVGAAQRRAAPHVERLWEPVATRMLMTLDVPGQTLHLAHDVPPVPGHDLFPPALRRIDLPELEELMRRWDTTGGTGRDSGATDWAVLRERMGYFVNLYRSRQRHLELTASPFAPRELAGRSAAAVT